jgi:site-specific DNA recombinase
VNSRLKAPLLHTISAVPLTLKQRGVRYLLAGLLCCGSCGRRLESAWSNGKPAYRCRHGYTSATQPHPDRPRNLYVSEDKIMPRLAALAILHAGGPDRLAGRKGSRAAITAPDHAVGLIDHLRTTGVSPIYDPATHALRTDTQDAIPISAG